MKLLFVCVGNTCRSQIAEALAKNMGFQAQSAGTHPGENVAKNAKLVIKELGIEMEKQYSKSIDEIDTQSFDKIISMGCGVECPDININLDWKLEDPLGKNIEFYRDTRDKILKYILQLEQLHTDV